VCKQRDPSGLYAAWELNPEVVVDLPGVSFTYDEPEDADLMLDTSAQSVDECINQVVRLLRSKKVI